VIANPVHVAFSDGVHRIPACYDEFARRYPDRDGPLYQGFIVASADKIFESTSRGRSSRATADGATLRALPVRSSG
jgi:hypothetical protein